MIAALPDALLHAVQAAYAPVRVQGINPIDPRDPKAHTRSDPLPDSARRVRLADAGATCVYVNSRNGRILMQIGRERGAAGDGAGLPNLRPTCYVGRE